MTAQPTTRGAPSTRRAVWATRLVFAVNGGLFASWVSRLPAVRDELGATERGLGFALFFIAVGSLTAMPFSGKLVGAFGARRVMQVCIAGCALNFPLLAVAPNLVVLSAVLFVFGATSGVWDVAMNVSGHAVEVEARRSVMSGFHAAWSIGGVAGAGLGALAATLDVEPLGHFAAVALAGGVSALLAVRAMPDGTEEPHDEDAAAEHHVPSHGALIRDPRVLGLGIMTFCAAWAEGAANDWLALLLTDERDASGALAALGFAVFAGAMTTGRIAAGRVIDRIGRVRALRGGAAVATVGLVALLGLPWLPVAYVGAVLWGLGIAAAFPTAMTAAGETPGRGPSAIATVATIAYAGFLVGPPLIGTIAHSTGLDGALWLVVGLTVGVFALAGNAATPRRPAAATADADVPR